MVDKLEQSWATVHKEYCQNGGQKNLPEKKKTLVEEQTLQEIWVGSMTHAPKSLPYAGYTTKVIAHYFMITKHVFQKSTVDSKWLFKNKRKITKIC